MNSRSLRSVTVGALGLIAVLWLVLTLIALVGSVTGGNPLYSAVPGGLVLPSLTLFGKLYIAASALMPFVVIGAVAFI